MDPPVEAMTICVPSTSDSPSHQSHTPTKASMARAPRRTLTRTAAIKKLLDYRSESWDSDDTRKVIRKGREGLHEMSNRELAGLWEDWFEQRITVTGPEPIATIRIETSVLDAVVTALTDLTACVSMRGPSGTTAYLISHDRMQKAKAALALVKNKTRNGITHAT